MIGCLVLVLATQAGPGPAPADRLLVKIERTLPSSDGDVLDTTGDRALDRALARAGVVESRRVFRRPPRGWRDPVAAERFGLDRWLLVSFADGGAELQRAAERLRRLAEVELCQPDALGTAADTTPDDPSFAGQYALQNGLLNAPQAWDLQTDSDHVVAVIDSGADLDHPDLLDNLWNNPGEMPGNAVDDDGNGYVDDVVGWDFAADDDDPDDELGHGIHVSGIAGAKTNNALNVAGVCWNVPLMEVRIIDENGLAPQSRAAAGIVYAVDNGATVLNNSYGYVFGGQVLRDAVSYAAALDAVIVAAAHNQGGTNRRYPAAFPEAMGIIATDANDQKPGFSNYGPWCDMAAPGLSVLSLWLNGGTLHGTGTSMSTPHVAGAAALVRTLNPGLDAVDTRWILNYSSVDLGSAGFDDSFGWGRLDLAAALRRARSLTLSENRVPPGATVTLQLSQPDEPGFLYLLLASRKGRVPGTPAGAFGQPDDLRRIPLNADPHLFSVIQNNPGGTSALMGFVGVLDGSGAATAVLQLPRAPKPAAVQLELDFAFLTFDPNDPTRVASISTSNHLEVAVEIH